MILEKLKKLISMPLVKEDYQTIVDIIDEEVRTSDLSNIWVVDSMIAKAIASNDEEQIQEPISASYRNKTGFECIVARDRFEICILPTYSIANKIFINTGVWSAFAFIILVFISIYFAAKIAGKLTEPIEKVVNASSKIAMGDFDISFQDSSISEVDTLNRSLIDTSAKLSDLTENLKKEKASLINTTDELERLAGTLRDEKERFHNSEKKYRTLFEKLQNAVNSKNYSFRIALESENDELATALNKILDTLEHSAVDTDRQNWIKTGQNKLNEKISGEKTISELCMAAVTFLAKYTAVQIGAIYIYDEDENLLRLISSYAYKERKNVSNRFKLGEGLVGQAALEKEAILFTEIPKDYIKIESAVGSAVPENILIIPLIYEDRIKGVVELGKIKRFTEIELDFIEKVAEHIAIALNSAEFSAKLRTLLDKTQKQAAELKIQQEELKQTNEELEEQTTTLKLSETKLQSQQEELQVANEEMEEKTEILEEQKNEIETKNSSLRKKQKEIEEKAKELELATRYKSEFLANMSHELRTPLNSLLLLAKMLSENEEENLSEDQIKSAQSIHRSGENLLHLINDILDLSKIEARKIELNVEKSSLKSLLAHIKSEFEHLAKEKNLEFSVEKDDEVPEYITTDVHRFEQIIRNLLSNAFKFTLEGGVTVRFERPSSKLKIVRKDLIPASSIAIVVEDSGQGVPKVKQRQIFEAFKQVDGSISRRHGGTGLGLSISKELAYLIGGEISLESEEGKGSAFTLVIPEEFNSNEYKREFADVVADDIEENSESGDKVEPSREDVAHSNDEHSSFSSEKSMLIIEDDEIFADIIVDIAKKRGFECIHANSGENGVKFAFKYKPSAIILDIGLPGINGWNVLRELKNNEVTRHIPVHIISALDKDRKVESLKKGAIGYLAKPVDKEQIVSAMERIEEIISEKVRDLLIVEDNSELRSAIAKMMEKNDIKITATGSGKEALSLLQKSRYGAIILDLGLPDISGFDLLDKIRSDEFIAATPVIIFTGRELASEEVEKLDKYAATIVLKNADSFSRLLDETVLFLHKVEKELPEDQRSLIRKLHDKDSVLRDKKVLIVDDDMRNAYALNTFLSSKGMNTKMANNGKTALAMLEKEPEVDLILTDIMMPVMDGYELMRTLRSKDEFSDIPILAITAKAMTSDREECIKNGANDYLSKPLDTVKLLSMMRVWLYK